IYAAGSGTGASTITEATVALRVGPYTTRSGTAGSYLAGISFNSLLNYQNGSTYDQHSHAWIGLKTYDYPGWERSALVFATNDTTSSNTVPVERMIILPNGNIGIGTSSPAGKLHIASNSSDGSTPSLHISYGGGSHTGDGIRMVAANVGDILDVTGSVGSGYFKVTTAYNAHPNLYISGKIGVGTASPTQKLHVSGNLRVTGAYYDSSNTSGSNGQVLTSTGSGTKWMNVSSFADSDWVVAGSNMYAGVSGRVGIGTSGPATKLEVRDSTWPQIRATGSGTHAAIQLSRSALNAGENMVSFGTAGANTWEIYNPTGTDNRLDIWRSGHGTIISFQNTGRVGVGTTSPTQLLHVAGNIRVTGAYYDSSNSAGSNGQILLSTGSSTKWVNPGTLSGSYILNQFSSAQAANFYIAGQGRVNGNFVTMGAIAVGTTSTSGGKIVLQNNGEADIRYIDTSASQDWQVGTNTNGFWIWDTTYRFVVKKGTGYIGIGTTSPSQKLHVAGNLRVTGAYYDSSNSAGTSGYLLQSTGSGTKWINPASLSISDGD
ncbi:MAG: hypothetical protein D6795_14905, partial [Deltaproteobacteria bacterium]